MTYLYLTLRLATMIARDSRGCAFLIVFRQAVSPLRSILFFLFGKVSAGGGFGDALPGEQ